MKKVQVGARVSPEDAEFINLLEVDGARTPSDKLRAIIEEARLRRNLSNDYTGSFRVIHEQLGPLMEKIKKVEFENNTHSALLVRIFEWMPDFYAYCLTSLAADSLESPGKLEGFEKGVVERVTRLFEALLHLELSSQKMSYTPEVVRDFISPLEKVMHIISSKTHRKEG